MSTKFDYYSPSERLNWGHLPHINYYGKEQRGKKRHYLNQSYEVESKKSHNNGYVYTEDSPLVRVANSVLSHDFKHPVLEKKSKSLGIQAEDIKESEDTNYSDTVEEPPKPKKKKLKKIVLRRIQDPKENDRDSYATLDPYSGYE